MHTRARARLCIGSGDSVESIKMEKNGAPSLCSFCAQNQ